MSKIIEWLKFYFIGFFSHGLSKEGSNHSFFNALLSFVLTFIIVCCGLFVGYSASFGVQYNSSDDFREFLYAAFADENSSNRIDLLVKDGYLIADVGGGERVNTLLGEGERYAINGYNLIVDTRPAATTYAEFTVQCKKTDNSEIDYSVYRSLADDEKSTYRLSLIYSGQTLDPAVKQNEYEQFLNNISTAGNEGYSEETATAYGQLKAELANGTLSTEQYAGGVYELYFNAYYKGLPNDSYGKAPTIRTYYLSAATYENSDRYITILDNVCFCAFKTNSGLAVEFSGYFNNLADGKISGDNLSVGQMRSNVDEMINKSFAAAGSLNFLVYIISLGRSCALFVMAIILISLIAFMVLKVRKVEDCPRYVDAIKIVCSFLLWSAIITFVLTLIISFFFARGTVFKAAEIILLCVLVLRTAVYVILELIADKKIKDSQSQKNSSQN